MTPFEIAERLQRAQIHFTMTTVRSGALMFQITVPGARWELEVFEDGHIEIERFVSLSGVGQIDGHQLETLLSHYSDEE